MKVLLVSRHADGRLKIDGGVDSAVLRPGEPLFLEEPTDEWFSEIAPAVRIGRLGMNISPENAPAYIDAMSIVHLLTPTADADIPAFFCDRAISPGQWLMPPDYDSDIAVTAHVVPLPPAPPQSRDFETMIGLGDVPHIVSTLSQKLTFKTGDIIVFRDRGIAMGHPQIDTSLDAQLNGTTVLNIRLK